MKVKILPVSTVPVSKCNHRHGAKATFSHQTDSRIESSIYAAELYGFKNNVRLGAFITNLLDGQFLGGVAETEQTGLMRHDIYYGTDFWKNPDTGVIEVIPDYFSTVYTEIGAQYFDVEIGQTKLARYPRHGQNMFDLSNGRLGYDFVNGIMGANNLQEVYGVDQAQQDWFISVLGRYPSALSYRNGDNSGALTHLNNWLSGRNSVPSPASISSPAPTQYGNNLGHPSAPTNRGLFINYPSSFRWWDAITYNGISRIDADNYTIENIENTILNGGWYRDFCHWHSAQANGTLPMVDEYLSMVRNAFGDAFVWTCSNGEALEYMFIRESTNRIVGIERDGMVIVIADIVDKFRETNTSGYSQALPLNRMNIPLSAHIDLSNTSLSGKSIKPSFGKAIALGEDKYIIEIPFNHKEQFQSVAITEGTNGIYNVERPVGILSVIGNKLVVEATQSVRAVAYAVDVGGAEYASLPIARSNVLSSTHTFNIPSGKDVRIGIINEFGMANLLTL